MASTLPLIVSGLGHGLERSGVDNITGFHVSDVLVYLEVFTVS